MVKGGAEFKQTWKYLYDDDGQLESASIVDNTQWRFSYANHFFVGCRKISNDYCQQKMQIVIMSFITVRIFGHEIPLLLC